jgi:hypothetical protein
MAEAADLTDEIARLEQRAAALRDVARAVDRSLVHELLSRSGAATWVGPTATWFDEVARAASAAADRARDDLREAARRLDERAADLHAERAALLTAAGGAGP